MDMFIDKIYNLTNQHLRYVKNLDTACKNGLAFSHKTEQECEFGQLLYGEVMPKLDSLQEDIRQNVLEVERLHRDFHAKAQNINCPCEKSDIDDLHKIADFLIIQLTKLDKKSKGNL